ncbi:MAG TPA: MBL fold metallo-hydrolase [Acidimicrobiales bacterium]|nr:MBL fold metallo-hydrolase [Acidimicrobiales bacterium]
MSGPVSIVDEGLGNTSYVVDLGDGRALVVDPERHPGAYLEQGRSIAYTVETHLHADFVSGSRELAALGATVVAPAAAGLEFPARALDDGDELDLGGLRLRALATPGHTPEHLAYLLLDGDRPTALFSGGSLLVGAVARTDLIAPDQTEDLARQLWRSLRARVLTLPDDLPVYPTHGAGSFCSAPAGGERTTTIGREKAANPLLAAADEDEFVRRLLGGLGTYPPYFLRLRDVNRRGPRLYGADDEPLPRLDANDQRDAWLVDVRSVECFAAGHIPGSISIAWRDVFATWLGWLVPFDAPVVFVVDGHDTAALAREARKIGYERLLGVVHVDDWDGPLQQTPLVDAARLDGRVIDVRQQSEFDAGHVDQAEHVELGDVGDVDFSGPVTVMCGHGERAMSAASVLQRRGVRDVSVVTGGPSDWARATGRRLSTR